MLGAPMEKSMTSWPRASTAVRRFFMTVKMDSPKRSMRLENFMLIIPFSEFGDTVLLFRRRMQ